MYIVSHPQVPSAQTAALPLRMQIHRCIYTHIMHIHTHRLEFLSIASVCVYVYVLHICVLGVCGCDQYVYWISLRM